MPHVNHRILLSLTALAAFAVSGCSNDSAEKDTSQPVPTKARSDRDTAGDPATWTLPLMRYQPTSAEEKTIAAAEEHLVRQCAKTFGVNWNPDPPLPPIGGRNAMDWRYGIHDPALSAERGYQTDAAQQQRFDNAMSAMNKRPRPAAETTIVLMGVGIPGDVLAQADPQARKGIVAGRKVPEGGCTALARKKLGTTTQGVSPRAQELGVESYPESMKHRETKTAFANWSKCMKGRGFSYATPMEASDDPRFQPSNSKVSRTEIETALADIDCRRAHRVTEIWHSAEVKVQNDLMAKNAEALESARRSLDEVLLRSKEVLKRAA